MPEKAKQVITHADLLQKIQVLLLAYPKECRNISIDSVQVHEEYVDGANWYVATYRRSGEDNDLCECRQKIAAEIRHLRQCYDVEPQNSPFISTSASSRANA